MKPHVRHVYRCDSLAQHFFLQTRRQVHTTKPHQAIALTTPSTPPTAETVPHPRPHPRSITQTTPHPSPPQPALSILPLSTVLRTYLLSRMSSSPILLNACFASLNRMLRSTFLLTDLDRNPLLRWLLKKTFYAQFCAGESRSEVQRSIREIKELGYTGVILEYALEVLESKDGKGGAGAVPGADSARTKEEVDVWRRGMLETVEMAEEGDFVGLKWSGLGTHALHLLRHTRPPTPAMHDAIDAVCAVAAQKGVRLLPSAEEELTNTGIDAWTLGLQARYNAGGRAVVYTTYQAYLRSTPAKLAEHLAAARKGGFTAGVKIVRGAYLSSEPRERIWESKERTDEVYDGLVAAVLQRRYGGVLQAAVGEREAWPEVEVVLATHNAVSVERAQELRRAVVGRGEEGVNVAYAQLLGMADEVSCQLLKEARGGKCEGEGTVRPEVYKCAAWGTTRQCLGYLMRRAEENKDAVARTEETRRAMGREIWRRLSGVVGLA